MRDVLAILLLFVFGPCLHAQSPDPEPLSAQLVARPLSWNKDSLWNWFMQIQLFRKTGMKRCWSQACGICVIVGTETLC